MKKFLTRRNIIVAAILAVVAIGGWNQLRMKKANQQPETVTVERKDVQSVLTVSGEIKAERAATLNFPSPGKLAYVKVAIGDRVQAWRALAGMDVGDLRASERAAYYRYLAADANAKLVEDAVKGHDADETFIQKNDRVSAQAARDIAYDNWLVGRRAVSNANLISPFAGVVTGVSISSAGDTVGVTDGISLVDPASLSFEAQIDESDLAKVQEGASVQVKLDSYVDKIFTGTLAQIGFVAQTSSTGANVYLAKVRFSAEDTKLLRVGMSGDGKIILAEAKNVLTLPIDSVVDSYVWLPDQSKVKVQLGLEGDNEVEIKSGVSLGQKVLK